LRHGETMIDEESERAVERWVRLGDKATGRPEPEAKARCARCGSTHHVLDRGEQALCAHCYLESGAAVEPVESGVEGELVESGDDRGK
jgi:protein-arginine kinase activator protein McsA